MDRPVSAGPRANPGLLAFLRSTPPFDQLPDAVLGKLCLITKRMQLASGQTLFEKGDRGEAMYLVMHGRLQDSPESGGGGGGAPSPIPIWFAWRSPPWSTWPGKRHSCCSRSGA